jgi:pimeloyl-ACP methyl ester carboxylesterase
LLLIDLVVFRRPRLVIEDRSPLARLFHMAVYRMIFAPVALVLLVAALVWLGTHPEPVTASADPVAQGVYYDPITFNSLDNTRLEAWLVPVVDAKLVLEQKDDALHEKRPAVILVHDYGSSRQQMLPLLQPLHEAGFVVLALTLRGCGDSGPAGTTFGINESQDVEAAAQMLRRRPFVDSARIGLVGEGTGATACVLAARKDPALRALVLDHPVRRFEDVLTERIGARQPWLRWMDPLCRWTFQIGYKLDSEAISAEQFSTDLQERPVLIFDEDGVSCLQPRKMGQVVDFLTRQIKRP